MTETDLLWLTIQRCPTVHPHIRIFRRAVFNVEAKAGFRAVAGIKGQCDAWAYGKGGRVVEIEAKSARGQLEAAQKRWRAFCEEWGVQHLVWKARAGEDSDTTVARWLDELGALLPR